MEIRIIGKLFDIISTNPESPTIAEIPGWHINSTSPIEGLEFYRVNPTLPREVFYGVHTYYYRFSDEATARELLSEKCDQSVCIGLEF